MEVTVYNVPPQITNAQDRWEEGNKSNVQIASYQVTLALSALPLTSAKLLLVAKKVGGRPGGSRGLGKGGVVDVGDGGFIDVGDITFLKMPRQANTRVMLSKH